MANYCSAKERDEIIKILEICAKEAKIWPAVNISIDDGEDNVMSVASLLIEIKDAKEFSEQFFALLKEAAIKSNLDIVEYVRKSYDPERFQGGGCCEGGQCGCK